MRNTQRSLPRLLVPLVLCGAATWAQAQAYKCQSQGKTVYSQEPCPGAVTVDTTPAAGAAPPKGQAQPGGPARQGEAAPATETRSVESVVRASRQEQERRAKLPPAALAECYSLDAEAKRLTETISTAKGPGLGDASNAYAANRKKAVALRC